MVAINNTTKQKINLKKIETIMERFLSAYHKTGWEVSLAIVGPARIKRLNREYRGIDRPTDVLSFGAGQSLRPAPKYLGEVVINIMDTQKPGKYRQVFTKPPRPDYLFYFLLVHGLLHLVGYDDAKEAERQRMLELGRNFLKKVL